MIVDIQNIFQSLFFNTLRRLPTMFVLTVTLNVSLVSPLLITINRGRFVLPCLLSFDHMFTFGSIITLLSWALFPGARPLRLASRPIELPFLNALSTISFDVWPRTYGSRLLYVRRRYCSKETVFWFTRRLLLATLLGDLLVALSFLHSIILIVRSNWPKLSVWVCVACGCHVYPVIEKLALLWGGDKLAIGGCYSVRCRDGREREKVDSYCY